MSKPEQYKRGDHWVECERCGFVYRASKMTKEWTGLIVCRSCRETRHPQDFVRGRKDDQTPKGLVRPESPDTFIEIDRLTTTTDVPEGTFTNNNEDI